VDTATAEPVKSELPAAEWAAIAHARSRWNHAMKLVRRIHLYSGLFMFPFVILYGSTAFLFNHPAAFSEVESPRMFDEREIAGTPLTQLPQAREIAGQVVAAIETAERAKGSQATFKLIEDDVHFARPQAIVTAKDGDNRYGVSVFLDDGTGSVRTFKEQPPAPAKAPAPFVDRELKVEAPLEQKLRDGVPGMLEKLSLKTQEIASVSIPDLQFRMEVDGKRYFVSYNMQRGSLTATDTIPEGMAARRFLTRLHLAHGYPDRINLRWFWALAVDAMFVAMIFWGISGLFMWWQIKKTRFWGVLLFLASLIICTVLFAGMHASLSSVAAIKEPIKLTEESKAKQRLSMGEKK